MPANLMSNATSCGPTSRRSMVVLVSGSVADVAAMAVTVVVMSSLCPLLVVVQSGQSAQRPSQLKGLAKVTESERDVASRAVPTEAGPRIVPDSGNWQVKDPGRGPRR